MFANKFKKIIFFGIATLLLSCSLNSNIVDANKNLETGNLVLQIPLSSFDKLANFSSSAFKIKYLDPTDVLYGMVSINGLGFSSQYTESISPENPVKLIDGNTAPNSVSISMNSIPVGNNRVIKVQAMDKNKNLIGNGDFDISAPVNIIANTTTYVKVNWQTTPAGKIIDTLINNNSPYTNTINQNSLENLVYKITTNNTQELSDDIHPSLVNTSAIINYINANSGNLPNPLTSNEILSYRIPSGTITGKISGITYSIPNVDKVLVKYIPNTQIICNDSASKPVTLTDKDGNYTITGVKPGSAYTVSVIPQYHTKATLNNISSSSSNVNFSISSENYISKSISSSNGVTHFKTSRPINVQIIKPNSTKASTIGYLDSNNREALIEALNMWQNLGEGAINFNILPDIYDDDPNLQQKKEQSDIYIEWEKIIESTNLSMTTLFPDTSKTAIPPKPSSVVKPTYNYTTMPYNNVYRVAINLSTYKCTCTDTKYIITNKNELKALALHEIGLALGLTVDAINSDYTSDVTCSISESNQINWNISTRVSCLSNCL